MFRTHINVSGSHYSRFIRSVFEAIHNASPCTVLDLPKDPGVMS